MIVFQSDGESTTARSWKNERTERERVRRERRENKNGKNNTKSDVKTFIQNKADAECECRISYAVCLCVLVQMSDLKLDFICAKV